jgi:hypothetical protein
MITAEELRLAAVNSTGSGRGMSFLTMAAACGKKAWLTEERDRARAETLEEATYDPYKPAAFIVGGVYHRLHEMWRQNQLDDRPLALETEDISVHLGAKLFEAYRSTWPMHLWGRPIAIEKVIDAKVDGVTVNAKPDLVVELGPAEVARASERCGTEIHPGRYIVDLKTEARVYDDMYYTGGLQALWYPVAWNQVHPEEPVDGIIFDIVRKPNARAKDQTISLDNYRAIYTPLYLNDTADLVGLVQQAEVNLERARETGRGNRAECVRFGFGGADVCPFFAGMCDGA